MLLEGMIFAPAQCVYIATHARAPHRAMLAMTCKAHWDALKHLTIPEGARLRLRPHVWRALESHIPRLLRASFPGVGFHARIGVGHLFYAAEFARHRGVHSSVRDPPPSGATAITVQTHNGVRFAVDYEDMASGLILIPGAAPQAYGRGAAEGIAECWGRIVGAQGK